MTVELGVIEGRFGTPWSWEERSEVMRTLAGTGYRFYHYGPKGDAHLRRTWREPHPPAQTAALAAFAGDCRDAGVRFGIALTPMGATHPFDDAARGQLIARLAAFDAIGIDDLAILFDDLRGDLPDLARQQAELVDFCSQHTRATRLYFCPSYYSYDPVLDRVFGRRPEGYLAELGRLLDPAVRIYWTGEEVFSPEISVAHLREVEAELGRKVCLWDNYPVNDGSRMSRFLHLRGFTGRPPAIAGHLTGHAINPAIQPRLSCIPALTLAANYAQGDGYSYGRAFDTAARALLGDELAAMVRDDLLALQDTGWERLDARREVLRARYADIDQPAAREIVDWLDGHHIMTDDEVKTQ